MFPTVYIYFELRGSEREKMTNVYFDKYNLMVSVVRQLHAQVCDPSPSQQVGTTKGRRCRDVIVEKRLPKMKVGELREECLTRGFNDFGTTPELHLRIGLEITGRRCKCETAVVHGLSAPVRTGKAGAGAVGSDAVVGLPSRIIVDGDDLFYAGGNNDDGVADGGDCERTKDIDEVFFDSDGSTSNDSDDIDANGGEQLQQSQITGAAKEQRIVSYGRSRKSKKQQLIRDLYDHVADGGDRDRTKNIDTDSLDSDGSSSDDGGGSSNNGSDSSSNGGDDSGSGDGGSSGVDDGEQLQQSKTKEPAMEQRMVTANDDGEQPQQSKTTEAAMEERMSMFLWYMADYIDMRHRKLKLDDTRPSDRAEVRESYSFLRAEIGDSMPNGFTRLHTAFADEIEWKVRVFHNKRVQDEELRQKEELRDLVAKE